MAYKFKRYKIKWNLAKRKFKKVKKDRTRSRNAYYRWRKNKSKMLTALRKNRKKIKRKAARNKNAGIQQKLAIARKRFKSLLKNSLDYAVDNFLFEEVEMEPEVEIDENDLKELSDVLDDIKAAFQPEDEEDKELFNQYIKDSKELIDHVLDMGDEPEDKKEEEMVSGILRFVDLFLKIKNEEEE